MANKIKNICLIPARGGSKRIPQKNIIDFYGKPLIAHTIQAAIKSKLFGRNIYVSSDSEEILSAADKYGVQKIKRPAEISGDKATLEDATSHLLKNTKGKFDYLCLLMPNCPLRTAEDIRLSYKIIIKAKANCLMSVINYYWLNPFWVMREKGKSIEMFFGKKYLVDSKALPDNTYCPTGAVRWVKVNNFLREKKYYGQGLIKYKIPFERSADIDDYEDLELAKKLYKLKDYGKANKR